MGEVQGEANPSSSLQRCDLRWFNLQLRLLSKTYSGCYAYIENTQEIALVCAEREGGVQASRLIGKQSRRKINQHKKAPHRENPLDSLLLWELSWKRGLQPFPSLLSSPSPQWFKGPTWFYRLFWSFASQTIVTLSRHYRSTKQWRSFKTPVGQELILAAMSD